MSVKLFQKYILASLNDRKESKINEVIDWIKHKNASTTVNVNKVPLNELKQWNLTDGKFSHHTGAFFSIEALEINNISENKVWDQPIINQPEIGYLGIITKIIDGKLKFLLQAKIEPGNINNVQLSPTLQATYSNFTMKHKGRKPMFLDYFQNYDKKYVIVDRLLSEQGSRFYKKRNRNIIININTEINIPDNFIWLTFGEIKELMTFDNVINMDTRTVLSLLNISALGIGLSDLTTVKNPALTLRLLNSLNSYSQTDFILNKMTDKKFLNPMIVKVKRLDQLKDWDYDGITISNKKSKYFKVIGANIEIQGREVVNWDQPLVEPIENGLCLLYLSNYQDKLCALIRINHEAGYLDISELGPTIQKSSVQDIGNNPIAAKIFEEVTNYKDNIIYDTMQSEEGGRFFKEENRNMIYLSDSNSLNIKDLEDNDLYWVSLGSLFNLNYYSTNLNIQLRNLISVLKFDIC